MGESNNVSKAEKIKALKEMADNQKSIIKKHTDNGVMFLDPSTVFISPQAKIGKDTIIYGGVLIEGDTVIGDSCEIGPDSRLVEAKISDWAEVSYSVVLKSAVGESSSVGPFAYVRPGSVIGAHVKVGDFVEVKNSVIGDNTKISHLAYVGDSDFGKGINFSCGAITSNYDGKNKFRTTVGDGVFVGCNTNLVSPVKVGENAFIAAGSTISEDIPDEGFSIARAKQINKSGWVKPKDRA